MCKSGWLTEWFDKMTTVCHVTMVILCLQWCVTESECVLEKGRVVDVAVAVLIVGNDMFGVVATAKMNAAKRVIKKKKRV